MTEPALKSTMQSYYPTVEPNPDFAKIEEKIQAFWQEDDTFRKSVENRPATISTATKKGGQQADPALSASDSEQSIGRAAGEPGGNHKNNEYVFYDGPPFANGLPHYGHLLTGYVKDLYARYHTMKGQRVERRFGWDCHGLPAEMGAEKGLGISGRKAIEDYGIGKFNEYCRSSVMTFSSDWEEYVNRQGRWVDFEGDYKTMDKNFMESVLWAFKELYKKGLIFESHRVMPYSWAAETPLSNFETKLDNSYRERTDKAITVKFKLKERPKGAPEAENYYLLAWTTTPWTLPSNLALAASKRVIYTSIVKDGECYIVSKDYVPQLVKILYEDVEVDVTVCENGLKHFRAKAADSNNIHEEVQSFIDASYSGERLLSLEYEPLFPYFKDHPNAFRVLDGSSFIEEGSGTGIVHMAPGFGEDDQRVCKENGIDVVVPVDEQGKYTNEIFDIGMKGGQQADPALSVSGANSPLHEQQASAGAIKELPPLTLKGLNVIAQTEGKCDAEPYTDDQLEKYGLANLRIINWLKLTDKLVKQEDYKHNYPHCWRTDKPLIYRALPSWYVAVTKIRDRAVELNREINWIPEHIGPGQMEHMLSTAPDWSISRNRFWGTPIPIWRSDNPDNDELYVFGSIEELEEFFGQKVEDLHRPYIDELTKPDPTNPEYTLRRVTDVFDCWFESGSMPFAQVHYPFENKEWFEAHYPADFITEYVGQTRGWFNTLIILATALFDRPPFKNCICHGVVLDSETGLKYSKRLKNYKNPLEVIDQFGADALRWLMIASPVMRGHDLSVDPEGKFIRDVVRLHIKPIWNAYNFFTLYANADGVKAEFSTDSANLMDRYILAKCREAVVQIEQGLDAYDTPAACIALSDFFEVLNNWYIRRNKERFWNESGDDTDQEAYNTLYTVLHTMCRAAAPLLPYTLEEIYQGLAGGESVHLADFPDVEVFASPGKVRPVYRWEWDGSEKVSLECADSAIALQMDKVQDICRVAHSIRTKYDVRVRQPLASLKVAADYGEAIQNDLFSSIIRDEVNVKNILLGNVGLNEYATRQLKIHFPVLGKRLPEKMKQIIPASKKGEWELKDGELVICGEVLLPEEYDLQLQPKDGIEGAAALSTNDALVVLDLEITPELELEGLARDFVRMVQEARKTADLNVADRIQLQVEASGKLADAIKEEANRAYIMGQVLATSLELESVTAQHRFEQELDGVKVTFGFKVA